MLQFLADVFLPSTFAFIINQPSYHSAPYSTV
jgi:hypothetical protein